MKQAWRRTWLTTLMSKVLWNGRSTLQALLGPLHELQVESREMERHDIKIILMLRSHSISRRDFDWTITRRRCHVLELWNSIWSPHFLEISIHAPLPYCFLPFKVIL